MFNNSDYRPDCTSTFSPDELAPMQNHPFQVRDDDEMQQLIESIKEYGLIDPILVRPNPHAIGKAYYEIVSGHRRFEACKRLGFEEIPAIIRNLNDDEAIIAMVDSNLHRERLLPSEKARSYKMKFDVLKRQGARRDLSFEPKELRLSTEIIAEQENTSKDTVKRYIRLTKLAKPLLDMVDEGKIGLTIAEKLSYLTENEQVSLAELIQDYETKPTLSQATQMKEKSARRELDADTMFEIMEQPKPNQKEMLKLDLYKLRDIFPNCLPKDMEKAIYQILAEWQEREQSRERIRSSWDRDAR